MSIGFVAVIVLACIGSGAIAAAIAAGIYKISNWAKEMESKICILESKINVVEYRIKGLQEDGEDDG